MVLYAKDIVEKDFLSLPEDTTVLEAARQMKDSKHGFAVIGSVSHPKGIVTEWDVLAKVVAEGRDPRDARMAEIMSTAIVSVDANTGIATLSQMMSEKRVRRMVVKQGDEVIGFVTSKTLLARLNDYVDKVSSQISRLQAPWL